MPNYRCDETCKGTGAAEQLASLSAFALGRYQEALDWAQKALALDPKSPLYQEAVADAMRALGQAAPSSPSSVSATSTGAATGSPSAATPSNNGAPSSPTTSPPAPGAGTRPTASDPTRQGAMDAYWTAVDLDPTLFSTWNNLGVLYAQDGNLAQAITCFKQAVRARPDYPLGWFNLGVAQGQQPGIGAFLRSQGAFGKAGQLNHGLKNQAVGLAFDDQVYDAHLDVSKPIPADWHLSQTVRANPTPLTIGLIVMIVLRGAWAFGSDWFAMHGSAGALRLWSRKRPGLERFLNGRIAAAWTTLITFAALLWLAGVSGWREYALVGMGFAALLTIHSLAPRFATTLAEPHTSVLPASLITVVLAPFGIAFTPPAPLVDDDGIPLWARRSGVTALAAVAAVFCLVAWITAVPLIRAAATGCLVLVTSALVPVRPLDGSRLDLRRWMDWAITIALSTFTVLFALGVV